MRTHICAWPNCTQSVSMVNYMCNSHWFDLPWKYRAMIYNTYDPDSEGTPEFEEAAKIVFDYIAEKFPLKERT